MNLADTAKRILPYRLRYFLGVRGIGLIAKSGVAISLFSLLMDSHPSKLVMLPDGLCLRDIDGRSIICHRDGFRIFHEIFETRPYEKYWSPMRGDTVLDLGAYVGMFSYRASRLVGQSGRVIALEPDIHNLQILRINLRGLDNVTIIPAVVSDYDGTTDLYLSPKTTCHNTIDPSNRISRVEAITIDTLVSRLKLNRVDFIKMDVEGAEMLSLIGAKETLKGNVRLAIEYYHLPTRKRPIMQQLVSFLEGHGYKVRVEREYIYADKV